jgi:hypothetical protein
VVAKFDLLVRQGLGKGFINKLLRKITRVVRSKGFRQLIIDEAPGNGIVTPPFLEEPISPILGTAKNGAAGVHKIDREY